jgi:hypothetical protein
MADADIPSSWSSAGRNILGNSIWILPLVTFERATEGHWNQVAIFGAAWAGAILIAVKLHVLHDIVSSQERRRQLLVWALILGGTLLLALGIFKLATRELPQPDNEQLHSLQLQLQGERDARLALDRQLATTRRELQEFQQRTRAAAPSPPISPSGERKFTNKTIHQLRQFYEGRTALQAEAFIADEKGKFIDVTGKVVMIQSGMAFLSSLENQSDSVECRFEMSWNAKLSTFRQGETMKVRGIIAPTQNGAQIYLNNCEILD